MVHSKFSDDLKRQKIEEDAARCWPLAGAVEVP
jgi:hypothetical protein